MGGSALVLATLWAAVLAPGEARLVPGPVAGPQAELRLRLVTPDETTQPGLEFGFCEGSAAPGARLCTLRFDAGGQLTSFDGRSWRRLLPYQAGRRYAVTVRLDAPRALFSVALQPQDGDGLESAPVPYQNLIDLPSAAFVAGDDRGLESIEYDPTPPYRFRPQVRAELLGADTVRLSWSAEGRPTGFRVYRNGDPAATLGPDRRVWLDERLAPRTRYAYEVEAVGGERSVPRVLITGPATELRRARPAGYDAIVYGATPSGIAAAVTLGRHGRQVLLLEPGDAIGGMMAGGLTQTDLRDEHALGGMFREYQRAVREYYGDQYADQEALDRATMRGVWFEPSAARAIFARWLEEAGVTLLRRCPLVGVKTVDRHVRGVVVEDLRANTRCTLTAQVFIDATYEGDLAAYAGASYLVGRESRADYGEPHAGRIWWDVWLGQITEVEGTGDRKVQAYCYRLCLTDDPANRLPPPSPRNYDRSRYLGLLDYIPPEPQPPAARDRLFDGPFGLTEHVIYISPPMPGRSGKRDANNNPRGRPSLDLVGGADAWPEATWTERDRLRRQHIDHTLGLLWFLRNDPAVPEYFRRQAQVWGLPRDEFPELDGWPSRLYVREARRILGGQVFREQDAAAEPGRERPPTRRDSIAVGGYQIDSHATGDFHATQPDWLEGFFWLSRQQTKSYQVPYALLVPQGVEDLLVSCCVSATHVGFGTLRMEPVFTAMGHAAGLAASHALAEGRPPRGIDVLRLQRELLEQEAILTPFSDVTVETLGSRGFNLWGTFGAFESYEAKPDEPLTADELRRWAALAPWPEWRQAAERLPSGGAEAGPAALAALARELGQLVPARAGASVSRAEAMAVMWEWIP